MAAHDVQAFRGVIVRLLTRKFAEALATSPAGYTARLVDTAMTCCAQSGFDRQGTVIEFAESMVKNDLHPLTPPQIMAKAQTTLREFQSRALSQSLRALEASRRAAIGSPSAPAASAPAQE